MQIYLVGGAVRDGLLGLPIKDKDYVVVGATPQQMLDLGFLQVGADFPVFLHPHSKQEYALARTERKSGKGYKGFEVYAAPDVTLEEDLIRRDLTINAMAIEVKGIEDDTPINGNVIDPYGGQEDINNRILRHVSNAFSEDPLRILRLARFYSRFYGYHCDRLIDAPFTISQSTKTLVDDIIIAGELAHLTAERVWQETQRALMQRAPQAYMQCLSDLHALPHLMPNVAKLWQQPHTRQLLNRALKLSATANLTLAQRWAIIMSGFIDDDKSSVEVMQTLKDIGSAVKTPKAITQFAIQFAAVSTQLLRLTLLDAKELANLISQTRAYKDKAQDLNDLLVVQHTLQLAQQQLAVQDYIDAYNQVGMQDIDSSLQGAAIGDALMQARTKAIEDIMQKSRI